MEGPLLHAGLRQRIVADSAATEGRYALLELAGERGAGTPPHLHRREEEAVLLLDGVLEVCVDGERTQLGAGEAMRLPRSVPHSVTVASEAASWLCVHVPGGYEALVRSAGDGSWAEPDDDLAALLTAAGIDRVRTRW
jgi:quercetin dioxygenase-like cupin family protein